MTDPIKRKMLTEEEMKALYDYLNDIDADGITLNELFMWQEARASVRLDKQEVIIDQSTTKEE